MENLFEYWKSKEGAPVIFTGKMKMLDEGTVGVLQNVHEDWCTIIYPQNQSFEEDGKGGWKPKKGAPNKVYAHSVSLTEIIEPG